MTPEQRSDYLQLFSAFVLKVYSSRLGGYAGETFKVTGTRPAGKQDILVRTEIIRPSGPPLDCEWRVRVIDGRQRIIDVMVAGDQYVSRTRFPWTQNWLNRSVQGGPEHDR